MHLGHLGRKAYDLGLDLSQAGNRLLVVLDPQSSLYPLAEFAVNCSRCRNTSVFECSIDPAGFHAVICMIGLSTGKLPGSCLPQTLGDQRRELIARVIGAFRPHREHRKPSSTV
jgi:hypothetical protein